MGVNELYIKYTVNFEMTIVKIATLEKPNKLKAKHQSHGTTSPLNEATVSVQTLKKKKSFEQL